MDKFVRHREVLEHSVSEDLSTIMESDQNQPSKNTKPVSTIEPVVEYSYLKDWTPEYLASAEFELVVQKELLPVHKSVMGLSPVFQKELFKTESKKSVLNAALKKKDGVPVSTRLQLSSPLFLDVTVSDMCLLLSHVYATEATLSAERLHELRKLFYLTEEFGFPTITRRCVNFIRHTENLSSGIESDLEEHGATAASEWLELAVKWNFDSIKDDICKFAGNVYVIKRSLKGCVQGSISLKSLEEKKVKRRTRNGQIWQ